MLNYLGGGKNAQNTTTRSGKDKRERLLSKRQKGNHRNMTEEVIESSKKFWCNKNIRPSVPCHHIREYSYAYGAVEPLK